MDKECKCKNCHENDVYKNLEKKLNAMTKKELINWIIKNQKGE